jgi:putative Holliday junction resolvase
VRAGYVLAFDYGERHVGVAVGQTVTATASPVATLDGRSPRRLLADIRSLVAEWRPRALVVGLPLNMDDTESDMSRRARAFAARLAAATTLAVHLVDERLTTREARAQGSGRSADHALAAALIAETFLSEGATETL